MKKPLIMIALLLLVEVMQAQVTVTVVVTDGTSHEVAVDATGEIYFGTDYMAIMPTASASQLETFQMDDVRKVLFSGSTRIIDVRGTELCLMPNPVAESFTVKGIGSEPQLLTIYSVSGAQVLQGRYSDGQRIDVGHLPQGIYMVRVGMNVAKLVKR